jgi:hypothetical protein
MAECRWSVDDAAARDLFLRHTVGTLLAELRPGTSPRWGGMRPQDMVEHLVWAFELSTGRARVACLMPDTQVARARAFLASDRPMPREFKNPILLGGLPPLRYASLREATSVLDREIQSFLRQPTEPDPSYMHPVFGAIGIRDWHRMHYKHTYHHLQQFGLIDAECEQPGT